MSDLFSSGLLDRLPERSSARYILECLGMTAEDKLVVLYDPDCGRPEIAQQLQKAAESCGIPVLLIDLNEYFPNLPAEGEQRESIIADGIRSVNQVVHQFAPTKSYLASGNTARGVVMQKTLGCMPFQESETGIHTIHAHDPGVTIEMFEQYRDIDLNPIRATSEQVAEIMRTGRFEIHSELGTSLRVELDMDSYPIIRGTGEVAKMADDFYTGAETGGFWTNPKGGENFTFAPIVEGQAVCEFVPQYWAKLFDEYADLARQVLLTFHVRPNTDRTFSYIHELDVRAVADTEIEAAKISGLKQALITWLGIGDDPPNIRAIVGEVGIGLVEGMPIDNITHDEKLAGSFHLAFGGIPDDKATAMMRHRGEFPYEYSEVHDKHLDIAIPGTASRVE